MPGRRSAASARRRWRWPLVWLGAAVLGLLACRGLVGPHGHAGSDWQYLRFGADELLGRHHALAYGGIATDGRAAGGLHTYASYPFLQIGPPAIALATVLQWGPWHGLLTVAVLVCLAGAGCAVLVDRAMGGLASALAAALALVGWYQLARFHHLDDALVVGGVAVAAWGIQRASPLVTGVALGVAAAAKPWGAPLVVLALTLPGWRARATTAALAVGVTAGAWLPFVLADPRSLGVGAVGLYVSPDSVLGAAGVHHLAKGTDLRLVQLLGGLGLGYVLVRLGRWWAVPLAVFAWRLGIDPATYPYYAAALVPAAHLADRGSGHRFPSLTAAAAAATMGLELPTGMTSALLRTACFGGLLLVACGVRWSRPPQLTSAAPSGLPARPTRGLPAGA